jgi:YegS/Rv2252/BmrU family lipid kinase
LEALVVMTVWAIVNPISGRRKLSRLLEQLGPALAGHGYALEIMHTQNPGDAEILAGEAGAKVRAVLAVGGDGTVREVAAGLTGSKVPMVVVPAGTENIVAKHFGYRADAAGVTETIVTGHEAPCDVGLINGMKMLIVAGVGFDAAVVHRLAVRRTGHISYLTYVEPIWHTFWYHRFPQVRVEVDGQDVFEGAGMVFVGLLPRYSIGLRLIPNARCDDGLLDVCVFSCRSRAQLLRHAVRASVGRHMHSAGVLHYQGRRVLVSTKDKIVPVQVDGDPAGTLPIDCSVVDSGLRLLLPPPARGARPVDG